MDEEKTTITPLPQPLDLTHGQEITKHKHTSFDLMERFISINVPVYLVGPTGSGKTTAVEVIAQKLGLPFYRKVVGPESSEGSIFGFNNATAYVEGISFKPYTEGGILLIDEIDNGNPSTNIVVKMLSDGNKCNFPHGTFTKHPNFRLVANANTFGTGATRDYVGRSMQDAALLNIFAYIKWVYDEDFEYNICYDEYFRMNGEEKKRFNKYIISVWKIRMAIKELGIRHIVSPRNALYGSRMLAQKLDESIILNSVILRDLELDTAKKVIQKSKEMVHAKEKELKSKEDIKQELEEDRGDSKDSAKADYTKYLKDLQEGKKGEGESPKSFLELADLDNIVKKIKSDKEEKGFED